MKLSAPLIAVFVAALTLSACGGGSDSPSVVVASPATLTTSDTVVGTGATAATGTTATGNKGTQFDAGSFSFKLGGGSVITGFDQGVLGMKVGGTRTILIPSAQGYGSSGTTGIPGNSGLVFEVKLTAVM